MARNRLKELRAAAGLTAATLAEIAGTTEDRVYAVERGRYRPRPDEARRLADALGHPVETVFPPDNTLWRYR